GVLSPSPDYPSSPLWKKLSQRGWTRGDNLSVEHRTGNIATFQTLASELVSLGVALIIAEAEPPAQAAKRATDSVPIGGTVSDAVGAGLVASLAHPGGNLTGLSLFGREIGAKNLDLLRALAPDLSRVAVLWHPSIIDVAREYTGIAEAARIANIEVISAVAGF